jgi:hypothetical protein
MCFFCVSYCITGSCMDNVKQQFRTEVINNAIRGNIMIDMVHIDVHQYAKSFGNHIHKVAINNQQPQNVQLGKIHEMPSIVPKRNVLTLFNILDHNRIQ